MAFAVVVSWINYSVSARNAVAEPAAAFSANLQRFKTRLNEELRQGDTQQAKRTLNRLPRGLRNHVFVLDAEGQELLGRNRELDRIKRARVRISTSRLTTDTGESYTLITSSRRPPRPLLEPGFRGMGLRLTIAAAVSALVSLLLARYLATPLSQLSRASRQLATGDLSARVGSPLDQRKDEFGQLALDLDEMAARLQAAQLANQRLLRDVSHELRSPLARLMVALEIARNKDARAVEAELDRIELETRRLETLVDEVLGLLRDSSSAQQLNLEKFDLAELLQDLADTVNYEFTDGVQSIDLQLNPPLILDGDRELLWRVFENLLRNALIHSVDQGGIHISAALGEDGGLQVLTVCVNDSGPGIAERHLARIFEPFYRVEEARDRRSGGHGLGLAIAFSAVHRHGGTISASNREGGGLRVQVILPVIQKT